jgi:hypothetical protein
LALAKEETQPVSKYDICDNFDNEKEKEKD